MSTTAHRDPPKFGRNRVIAGLAASLTLATLALVWLLVFSRPASLLASVQNDLKHANSAHIVITHWGNNEAGQRRYLVRQGQGAAR